MADGKERIRHSCVKLEAKPLETLCFFLYNVW